MPFTAAHPMAVLPLWPARRRLHLDATCLVTGSIAPDFAGTIGLSFPGVGTGDYGFSPNAAPPDTNGAVGAL